MSARYYLLQTIRVLLISAATGSLVAFFLVALDMATNLRWEHPWLLYLLPVAGLGIWYLYHHYGKNSERGNNLLLNEIQSPDAGIPRRMAPLVLASTLITHLFGGSAGREGTANRPVQPESSPFVLFLRGTPATLAGFDGFFSCERLKSRYCHGLRCALG